MKSNDLKKRWKKGKVSVHTLVWNEGMDEWTEVQELPDLLEMLRGGSTSAEIR